MSKVRKLVKNYMNQNLFSSTISLFLEIVLCLCDVIRERMLADSIFYYELACDNIIGHVSGRLKPKKEFYVEQLLNFVYNALRDGNEGEKIINITPVIAGTGNQESDSVMIDSEIVILLRKAMAKSEMPESFEGLDKACEFLARRMISEELRKEYCSRLEELKISYNQIRNGSQWFCFPSQKDIETYLDCFYSLLAALLEYEENHFSKKDFKNQVIFPIMNLGYRSNAEGAQYAVFYHPVALSIWNEIYDGIERYLWYTDSTNMEKEICQHEIFHAKVQQAFRWIRVNEDRELFHVALPYSREQSPFLPKPEQIPFGSIPFRKLTDYNSYVGIHEERLLEKITYEMKRKSAELSCGTEQTGGIFKVTLFGDIDFKEFQILKEQVQKVIRLGKIENNIFEKAELTAHVKKREDRAAGIYSYQDELLEPDALKKIICSNDEVFLMDCCDLYDEVDVKPFGNPRLFKHLIRSESFSSFYGRKGKKDIVNKCLFIDLYNAFSAYCYAGVLGYFEKKANVELFRIVENMIAREAGGTAVYAYVADTHAFNDLYCSEDYYVRVEKYREKEVGIIRFVKNAEPEIPVSFDDQNNGRKIIVCNLWQFIKHVCLHMQEHFEQLVFGDQRESFMLDEVLIGIDYSDWSNEIRISYCLENEGNKVFPPITDARVEELISHVIIPSLQNENHDMYQEYFAKAYESFMYGNAKCVEDVLFWHIYETHRDMVGQIVYEGKKDVSRYRNRRYKYSYKRFYKQAMENFDTISDTHVGQYRVVKAINHSRDYLGNRNVSQNMEASGQLLRCIASACENIGYKNSFLYQNCTKEGY